MNSSAIRPTARGTQTPSSTDMGSTQARVSTTIRRKYGIAEARQPMAWTNLFKNALSDLNDPFAPGWPKRALDSE